MQRDESSEEAMNNDERLELTILAVLCVGQVLQAGAVEDGERLAGSNVSRHD